VLERVPPSDPGPALEDDAAVEVDAPFRGKAAPKKAGKRIKGRTIYLHDDLFERILVAAHLRDRTISEYVSAVLERQVPDHRVWAATLGDARAEVPANTAVLAAID
jgi:hypothetical protein